MSHKLLVLDIDGTLMGRDGSISPENRRVLAQVRKSDILVSLSTARALQACRRIIAELELDGCHIFFDGALIKNPAHEDEVYKKPIKPQLVKDMLEFARLKSIHLEVHSASQVFIEQGHWSIPIRRELFGIEPILASFDGLWRREQIIKVVSMIESASELEKARLFEDKFKDCVHFSWAMTPTYPDIHFLNLVGLGVTKGRALEVLASYLGVSLAEVAVAGDASNDISLLERAGLSIAMGNASDEVKAKADYVTLDVDQDGLAVAVSKFLLEPR